MAQSFPEPSVSGAPIATPQSDTISSVWKQAVSEYFETVQLSKNDTEWLYQLQSSSAVVATAVDRERMESTSPERYSERMFLSAVAAAGTHNQMLMKVHVLNHGNFHELVSNQVATFLRYASAIDAFLDSMGNTTFASAFVFGAIRFMLDVAVRNIKLVISIRAKFADVEMRLRRLDSYLNLKEPSEGVRLMSIRVLVNTLRFCGLATKYLSSTVD